MKKFCTAALAGVATLALAGTASAQVAPLDVDVSGGVKIAKKGKATPKKPKAAAVTHGFTANADAKKTASQLILYYPSTIKLGSGKGFPTCSIDVVAVDPASCPKGSKIGSGTASAVLGGPNPTPITFTTQVFVGGKNRVSLYLSATELQFQTAFPGVISKAGKKPFGQKVSVSIPESVQKPGGLFSYITSTKTTFGATYKKGKNKYYAATETGCPSDGKHHYGIEIVYVPNDAGTTGGTSDLFEGTSRCKR